MLNQEEQINVLKQSPLIKSLLIRCLEKLKESDHIDHIDYLEVVFEVAPYEGQNKPNIEEYLKENKYFGVEIFKDAEYPEEDTIEMKVITNIQLLLQEELE